MDIKSKLHLRGEQGKLDESDPRLRFKKRNTEVLDRQYEDRGKRTKATGMGKTIWNKELLDKYEINEFNCLKDGSYFFDVLPICFESDLPYSETLCVHFQVGFAGDHFICSHRLALGKCYRCEQQAKLFRETPKVPGGKVPDHIKALYPNDRMGYLIWERTAELLNGETPSNYLSVWNMPKKKVHEEIQTRVRDKISRTTLDISDLAPGGDGRTVSFDVQMEGTFPQYKGFELNPRPSPVPQEIAAKLTQLIEDAMAAGYKNAIQYLLHYPTYDEVKTSMLTEDESEEAPAPDVPPQPSQQKEGPLKIGEGVQIKSPKPPLQNVSVEEITNALITKYEILQSKLQKMNLIQWKMWLSTEGKEFKESVEGMEKEIAIQSIIEVLLEEECERSGIKL